MEGVTQINCMNGRHSDSLPCTHCGEDFSRGKSTLQETIEFLRDWPGEKPKVLDRNEANQILEQPTSPQTIAGLNRDR